MRVLDLFSGIGGFSLGLQRAGMTIGAFCEIDPFCRRVLAKHWPGVPIHDDVRTADFGPADIVVGGFPCQDISRAGKRAGITGERSGLYRELVRAIRMVRPKHAIVENVAALLGDGMGTVLGDLAESGYDTEWDCVPASALGAPHQRDRVWIVAHATDSAGIDDRRSHGTAPDGQEPQSGGGFGAAIAPDAAGIGRGSGRAGRPPDSFAWIRDAACGHAANADSEGLPERQGKRGDARAQQPAVERAACEDVWQSGWPCEPALCGVDARVSDRVDRVRALGNSLIPQIPELIGRAILAAEG